jgi:uncharacterized protein YbaR (Trm112 family)
MSRILKAKVEEIRKLRKAHFTLKETAERAHVHIRTVQKWDPLVQNSQNRKFEQSSVEDRLSALEEAVRTCWDWIDLLYVTMCRSPELADSLNNGTYQCPRCKGKLEYDASGENTWVCHGCGHKFSLPYYWCYHCLSLKEMTCVEVTGDLVCPSCGAKRYKLRNPAARGHEAGGENRVES